VRESTTEGGMSEEFQQWFEESFGYRLSAGEQVEL
jgi:hypothetical protein